MSNVYWQFMSNFIFKYVFTSVFNQIIEYLKNFNFLNTLQAY